MFINFDQLAVIGIISQGPTIYCLKLMLMLANNNLYRRDCAAGRNRSYRIASASNH
jgi:hypothetical protein